MLKRRKRKQSHQTMRFLIYVVLHTLNVLIGNYSTTIARFWISELEVEYTLNSSNPILMSKMRENTLFTHQINHLSKILLSTFLKVTFALLCCERT